MEFFSSFILLTDVFVGIFCASSYSYFQLSFSSISFNLFLSSAFPKLFVSSLVISSFACISFPLCSYNSIIDFIFSLFFKYTTSIQSKYDLHFCKIFFSILSLSAYILNRSDFSFKSFCVSLDIPVIYNFSFALVSATYNTLISSDIVSILFLIFIASLANVLYSILLS